MDEIGSFANSAGEINITKYINVMLPPLGIFINKFNILTRDLF
jgi:biopolymer transport protein ExbD